MSVPAVLLITITRLRAGSRTVTPAADLPGTFNDILSPAARSRHRVPRRINQEVSA